jgi:hypothetical protein
MEPIEHVLGLGIEIELKITNRIAAVAQKSHLLIHLHALGLQHFEQPSLGLGIAAPHEGKALRSVLGHTLAGDHLEVAPGA